MKEMVFALNTPCFRRRIALRARTDHQGHRCVRVALEDDFHHFRVELTVADDHIVTASSASPRRPYTLCPAAGAELQRLVGQRLPGHAHGVTALVDASGQCTHLLDMAGLATALARRGNEGRLYDIEVPVRDAQGRTRATLHRDGLSCLEWDIEGLTITGPKPYVGVELRRGLARWALTTLPAQEAEAALVLRRAAVISLGKGKPLDQQVHAIATGACFVQQAHRAPAALREVGSTWDFTDRANELCAEDARWLAFEEPQTA